MTDTPSTIPVLDGSAVLQTIGVLLDPNGTTAYPTHAMRANGAAVGETNPLPVRTPRLGFSAGATTAVATGGVAVIAIAGPVLGGYVTNPGTPADQGLAGTETLYLDPVNAPGSAPGAGRGTAVALDPGQTWVLPGPIPAGVTIRVNAASAGHNFSVVVWA